MYKIKTTLLFCFSFIALAISAQNNTNSPYTRFGYGDISNNSNGEQRAMGGITQATRSKNSINSANPASYTAVDSTTFMFDIGISAMASHFSDANGRKNTINGNLEYITLQLPIGKWIGLSAGLQPYSFVGYNMSESDSIQITSLTNTDGTDTYTECTKTFYGLGGISQVYLGLSVELFKHISLGANAYYMFGSIDNYRTISFTESIYSSKSVLSSISVHDFRFRYGIQAYHTFAQKHYVSLGATFENKSKLNSDYLQTEINSSDTVANVQDAFELPMSYGVGIAYTYDNRLTIGIDYSFQEWAKATYFGQTDSLRNRAKLAIGAEYVKNPNGNKYVDRMRFRAGVNASDPYITSSNDFWSKNFGITFGIGLPLRNSNTFINASFEYGKVGTVSTLREDYFKLTLNASVNENWFFKRKL